MISNLLSNAIKFTPQGGQIKIEFCEIERHEQTAVLELSVSDTGIGIENSKIALLFERFSQIDSSSTRKTDGAGLGLSIIKKLALLMGGEVGVESEVGRGSRFWFRFKAELNSVNGHEPMPLIKNETLNPTKKFGGTILVAEDNPINQKVIRLMINMLGPIPIITENGQQALDRILQGDKIDLILMDVQMPLMDGHTATKKIRTWEAENNRKRCPIIAITGAAFEEDRQKCLDAGMDDFITKPISSGNLRTILSKWLTPRVALLQS